MPEVNKAGPELNDRTIPAQKSANINFPHLHSLLCTKSPGVGSPTWLSWWFEAWR